jgi:4-amino-4-deoxy-L-arabinose transferase-like glycosyltransferase
MVSRDSHAHSAGIAPTLLVVAVAAIAVALRILAVLILNHPLRSDPLAYFTMAKGLIERGQWVDQFGQHVFFSAGYPLLLAPFFAVFGSSVPVAIAVNMLLTVVSVWLVFRMAILLSGNWKAGVLAAAVFAVWLPAIWNATLVAKENLSTPLLLGIALCGVLIARGRNPLAFTMLVGFLWGFALLTGGSSLLLCLGIVAALFIRQRSHARSALPVCGGLLFLLGALIPLAPWLYATNQMVGRPVLTTNAQFNLYLGNNPAADGRFVSIARTPLGKNWDAARLRLGEIGNADRLQHEALRWIADNPVKAGGLALHKLVYFWSPNIPDARDFKASRMIAAVHTLGVVQYLTIIILGFAAFRLSQVSSKEKWVFAAMIVGYWLVHAGAYIIPRYRDPVIPLLIIMASILAAGWLPPKAAPPSAARLEGEDFFTPPLGGEGEGQMPS